MNRWLFVLLVGVVQIGYGQHRYRVMHLNVENLFDCCHDSLKNDYEYLPDGAKQWHFGRYWRKVNQIAQTIAAVGEGQLPDLVSLCEVENDSTLIMLTRRSVLREARYRYLMTTSEDPRGIEVALLYLPGRFKPLMHKSVRIPSSHIKQSPTRDILHVVGRVPSGDTLDVLLCHFPSRAEGVRQSEPHRLLAASILKSYIDSLSLVRAEARLLVMGDFNDYPTNRSMVKVLRAVQPKDYIAENQLYNLMAGQKVGINGAKGTYRYRGAWCVLDHLLVNGRLLDGSQPFYTAYDSCRIMDFDFLTEPETTYGGRKPFRSYQGPLYKGGFSDHLPICADFVVSY